MEEVIIEFIKVTNSGAGETGKMIILKEAGEIEMGREAIEIREDTEAIGMEMKRGVVEIVAIGETGETGETRETGEIGDLEEIVMKIVEEDHGRIEGTETVNEVVEEEGAVVAFTMTETIITAKAKKRQKMNKKML